MLKTVGMRYNVLLKEKYVVDQYPELKHYSEFETKNEIDDKLIRFAMLMADSASPVYQHPDSTAYAREACRLAGIKEKKLIEELELSKNDKARKAMTRYFIITNAFEYELWLSLITSYNQFNYMLRMPVDNAKDPIRALEIKQKIALQLRDYLKEIKSIERELFKDDYVKGALRDGSSGREIHYPEMLADGAETVA